MLFKYRVSEEVGYSCTRKELSVYISEIPWRAFLEPCAPVAAPALIGMPLGEGDMVSYRKRFG